MPDNDVDPFLIDRLDETTIPQRRPPARATRPWAHRLAVSLVIGTMAAVLLCQLAVMAARPLQAIYRNGQEARQLERELAQLRARRAELEQRSRYLRTRQGIEEEARRQGWVMSGEVALQVIRPETPPDEDAAGNPDPVADERARRRNLWERLREFAGTCWHAITGSSRVP